MKKRDLYVSLQALNSVVELKGVKFAYTVLKNKRKLKELRYVKYTLKKTQKVNQLSSVINTNSLM
jgi:hypothetical protein